MPIQFISAMFTTKHSSAIQISWHFCSPFTLIPVERIAFPCSWMLARLKVTTESPVIRSLINHLSGGFMSSAK
jgi:hypothetical protein